MHLFIKISIELHFVVAVRGVVVVGVVKGTV